MLIYIKLCTHIGPVEVAEIPRMLREVSSFWGIPSTNIDSFSVSEIIT
jgi:hypothetical protein